jgi:hypothetical protein
MADKKSGYDRRQVLKYVLIGGVATAVVMPSKWVKPVVNAVIPPAHAAASAPATTLKAGTTAAKAVSTTLTPAQATALCNQNSTYTIGGQTVQATGVGNAAGSATCTVPGMGSFNK